MADTTVRIAVAHHLTWEGIELTPGDEIELPHHQARQFVASGYAAGVDPSDPEAVAKALAPQPARKQLAAKAPADKAEGKTGE
ncbi:hypothetical protein OG196_31855 [Kitasatospora purpeofusca]|uniref:hypothetical protein n=1 Tax=Kitasatospora purpeofusca TaxID=67352 RepID=UPI002E15FC03|nr:hypothetical protein OG196_31855 [Kitasatospora purpeofusca]